MNDGGKARPGPSRTRVRVNLALAGLLIAGAGVWVWRLTHRPEQEQLADAVRSLASTVLQRSRHLYCPLYLAQRSKSRLLGADSGSQRAWQWT